MIIKNMVVFAKCYWIVLICFVSVNSQELSDLVDLDEIINQLDIFNLPQFDISKVCEQLSNTTNIGSDKCKNQFEIVCRNRTIFWTMLDATSKFPYTGLMYKSKLDLGNFDECLTIDHFEDGTRILGKHCAAGLLIPSQLNATDPVKMIKTAFKLALCIPDACSPEDLVKIFRLPEVVRPLFNERFCTTKETGSNWSCSDIAIATLFVIFALLMIASTSYDIYIYVIQIEPVHPLLVTFSCLSNGRKLLHISKGYNEEFKVFHGLKFISMMWIIAGHSISVIISFVPLFNENGPSTWVQHRYSQYIFSAHLAVDTFFYISGFLLAYTYFKEDIPTKAQIKRLPYTLLHRYLRLTPPVAMLFLFGIGILPHIGMGPLYNETYSEFITQPCIKNWWSVFLYVQNYYNYDDLCFIPLWYISADMQLFILATIILIPMAVILRKNFKCSMNVLLVLNVLFTFLPLSTRLSFRDYKNEFDAHSRLVDYFIGVMFGIYMREKIKKPFQFSAKTNFFVWVLTLVGMFIVFMGKYEIEANHGYVAKTIYFSLMRPVWCIGLTWIVYSCHKGYGGFVNWILGHPIFQVGSKLVYCMYLTHIVVLFYYYAGTRTAPYFSDYVVFYDWCGHFMITLVISVFWTMAFESPLIAIEKYVFKKPTQLRPPKPINGFSKYQIQ